MEFKHMSWESTAPPLQSWPPPQAIPYPHHLRASHFIPDVARSTTVTTDSMDIVLPTRQPSLIVINSKAMKIDSTVSRTQSLIAIDAAIPSAESPSAQRFQTGGLGITSLDSSTQFEMPPTLVYPQWNTDDTANTLKSTYLKSPQLSSTVAQRGWNMESEVSVQVLPPTSNPSTNLTSGSPAQPYFKSPRLPTDRHHWDIENAEYGRAKVLQDCVLRRDISFPTSPVLSFGQVLSNRITHGVETEIPDSYLAQSTDCKDVDAESEPVKHPSSSLAFLELLSDATDSGVPRYKYHSPPA
ncbi:hypothetical protein Moror_3179 [Moniliophthora roreri MCA 2997]|uniref:Uncharacterized protein n=1 Tax=Moniliophthora roreri (strain MCA 2997) TaxID=1381753 RepID=V2X6W6_MONRO|nr:hypothetical protein Moror_3179 [Moniliophthora roreri MCA 2997]